MYTLQELLDSLSLKYLNNTSLVSEETGSIRESAMASCISALNTSILTIHARVTLRIKSIYIDSDIGVKQHSLLEKHTLRARNEYEADHDPNDPDYIPYPFPAYIREADDLLKDDILSLVDVYDSKDRYVYPKKVGVTLLEVDWSKLGTEYIKVVYRSSGVVIPYDVDSEYVVNFPAIGLPALEYFTAYQLLLSIGTDVANFTAREYMVKYEEAMTLLSENLTRHDQRHEEYSRFERDGWL